MANMSFYYKEDTIVRGYIHSSRRRTHVVYMKRKTVLLKTCVIKKTEIGVKSQFLKDTSVS
jgi:hypothetical protein